MFTNDWWFICCISVLCFQRSQLFEFDVMEVFLVSKVKNCQKCQKCVICDFWHICDFSIFGSTFPWQLVSAALPPHFWQAALMTCSMCDRARCVRMTLWGAVVDSRRSIQKRPNRIHRNFELASLGNGGSLGSNSRCSSSPASTSCGFACSWPLAAWFPCLCGLFLTAETRESDIR